MEKLVGSQRVKNTSHQARKSRRNGKVPGVLYGRNLTNLLFEIGELELNKEIAVNGDHGILDIEIDGQSHKTLIREVQKDPVNQKLVHIDLEELSNEREIVIDVPLIFTGEDRVSRNGGILQKERNKVKVQCMGNKVPKSINIDVSTLHIGDTCRVADIEFAKEISFIEDPHTVIATVTDDNTDAHVEPKEDTTMSTNSRIGGE